MPYSSVATVSCDYLQSSHILWGFVTILIESSRFAGRSSDSDITAFPNLPGTGPVVASAPGKTPSLRQQDCSGFSPDSLLSQETQRASLATGYRVFILSLWLIKSRGFTMVIDHHYYRVNHTWLARYSSNALISSDVGSSSSMSSHDLGFSKKVSLT